MPNIPRDSHMANINSHFTKAEVCDPELDKPDLDTPSDRLSTIVTNNVRTRARQAMLNTVQYKL